MAGNWYKYYRKTFDNPILCWPVNNTVWSYILSHVCYEPGECYFKGHRIQLKPGQGLFNQTEMAGKLHVTRLKVSRTLSCFKSETMIDTQTDHRNTLITVKSWNEYQSYDTPNEQPLNNQCTTVEQPVNNLPIKERNKELKNEKKKPQQNDESLLYYQNKIHPFVSQYEMEMVKSLAEDYTPDEFKKAVEITATNSSRNSKTWRYLAAVLKNQQKGDEPNGNWIERSAKKNDAAECVETLPGIVHV